MRKENNGYDREKKRLHHAKIYEMIVDVKKYAE